MEDQKRQILQEFEAIKASQTGYVKETKENFKDQFSFSDLKGILEERRDQFDYKITRMLNSYGYTDIRLRSKLDKKWDGINTKQPTYKKYIRPLNYVFPFNFVVQLVDDTSFLKQKIWTDYVAQAEDIVRKIINE